MRTPKAYVQLVCIAALLAAVLLWHVAPPMAGWDAGTVATLAAVALTAELMVYLLPRGAAASISFIPT